MHCWSRWAKHPRAPSTPRKAPGGTAGCDVSPPCCHLSLHWRCHLQLLPPCHCALGSQWMCGTGTYLAMTKWFWVRTCRSSFSCWRVFTFSSSRRFLSAWKGGTRVRRELENASDLPSAPSGGKLAQWEHGGIAPTPLPHSEGGTRLHPAPFQLQFLDGIQVGRRDGKRKAHLQPSL